MAHGKPRICNAIIADSDRDTIIVLCECAKNLLAGNVKHTPTQFRKLERHKSGLRTLLLVIIIVLLVVVVVLVVVVHRVPN